MIIFVIRNRLSNEAFVGSTRNELEYQWSKILHAASQNLDYPLYNSIRKYGKDAFEIEEWDYADDRQERISLEEEALKIFNAKSLRGYKTSNYNVKSAKQKETYISKAESTEEEKSHSSKKNSAKKRPIESIEIADADEDVTSYVDDEQLFEEDLIYIDKQLHSETNINNPKKEIKKVVSAEDNNTKSENTVIKPVVIVDKKQDNISAKNSCTVVPKNNEIAVKKKIILNNPQTNKQKISNITSNADNTITEDILSTNIADPPVKNVSNIFIEKIKLALVRHKSTLNETKSQEDKRCMEIKEKLKIFNE